MIIMPPFFAPCACNMFISQAVSDKQCKPGPNNTCAANEICTRPASICYTYSCNSTTRTVAATPCASPSICMLANAELLSATLQPDARRILLNLNKPAVAKQFACGSAFDTATTKALGGLNAQCSAEGSVLTIELPATATIMPGANLTLQLAQMDLWDSVAGTPFRGSVALAGCGGAGCLPPVALIGGPETIAKPCKANSTLGGVVLDASRSYDPSGRPLAALEWTLTAGSSAALARIVAAAQNSSRVVIRGADLDDVATGAYTLQLRAHSALGGESVASKTFQVVGSGVAPVLDLADAGATRRYLLRDGLRLAGAVAPESLCNGAAVNYSWTAADAASGAAWAALGDAATDRPTLLLPGPVHARHGDTHRLTLTAAVAGGGQPVSATVTVVAEGSPLVAALKGPSDYRSSAVAVLSATDSYDPDGEGRICWPSPC